MVNKMVIKENAIEITNIKVFPFHEVLLEFLLDCNMYSTVQNHTNCIDTHVMMQEMQCYLSSKFNLYGIDRL